MPASLPPNPSLRHLQLQAKSLLKAQRHGDLSAHPILRLLRRFHDASDAEIAVADVRLHEVQFALALHYGFRSWPDVRHHLQSLAQPGDCSLDAVRLRTQDEIPEYAAAGVPLAVVAALNQAGEKLDFVDLAGASGWAFSFGYQYDNISPAFMSVRGQPGQDGPAEVFSFLPTRLGYGYELARTGDIEELWPFVVRHVDQRRPIMSEHLDGGLITACRQENGRREIEFDGPVGGGWIAADHLQPYAVYVLVRERQALPWEQILDEAIRRAIQKNSPHSWQGVSQGLAALEAYCADIAAPDKLFENTGEWFCWAAFQRLTARKCAALWLKRVAPMFTNNVAHPLLEAAEHYAAAYEHYEGYRSTLQAGEPTTHDLVQRARTPERIAVLAPLLRAGIDAEALGWEMLRTAVT